MSRNIVLYISASLDGYIARDNGAVDWLTGSSGDENIDLGFDKFYSSVDTVVMGRTTYKQMINELSPDTWVYEGKKSYVASRKIDGDDTRVEYIKGDITGFIKDLKNQKGKDIWIIGGGKLIDEFIKKDMVDKYVITIIPTILGEGIPLFLGKNPEIKLKLVGTKEVDGMVELIYHKR